jgi:two-component sensor histidine kinase
MYPLALKEKGLATSLREYIFDWEARTDIQVKVEIADERRVHLDVEQAFYRAVQEALSNVARHSKATEVEITLTFLKKEIVALVKDNGCGFDKVSRHATVIGRCLVLVQLGTGKCKNDAAAQDRLLAQFVEKSKAIHARHVEVQQNHMRLALQPAAPRAAQRIDGHAAVDKARRLNGYTQGIERALDGLGIDLVVLDQNNV